MKPTKRRKNSNLGIELDKLWWEANSLKWEWRKQTEDFINMLCFRLGVPPLRLQYCTIGRQLLCSIKKKTECKACYVQAPAENTLAYIYVRDVTEFTHSVMLHELLHHINATHKSSAFNKVMSGWFRQFYNEKTGYRKFIKKARENIK